LRGFAGPCQTVGYVASSRLLYAATPRFCGNLAGHARSLSPTIERIRKVKSWIFSM
jgi:hypothetical protein